MSEHMRLAEKEMATSLNRIMANYLLTQSEVNDLLREMSKMNWRAPTYSVVSESQLCEHDIKVLRAANFEDVENISAGAAMWESIDYLMKLGYVKMESSDEGVRYISTDKGRAFLEEENNAKDVASK